MYLREGDGYRPMPVVHASVQKNMVLATFAGIDTLEDAISGEEDDEGAPTGLGAEGPVE